jgi:hypothetical protein
MGGIPPKKTLGGENWKSLLCIVPAELDATSDNRIRHSLVVGSGFLRFQESLATSSKHQSTLVEWAAFHQKRH